MAAPNDSHGLPISFLHCAWNVGNPPTADPGWENDVGEKIPNWVERARLYYQYSGDRTPLDYVKPLVDYSLDHGQTPTNFAGFRPEFATDVPTANWCPHPASPAEVNGQLTITNPLSDRTKFYRLKQPSRACADEFPE